MLVKKKIIIVAIVIALLVVGIWLRQSQTAATTPYQTATVEKGVLVESVSASGQVTSANNVSMTIQVAGVVKAVYVKNGDAVTTGQKIADLTLDQASQQKQAQAYANFLSASSNLAAAQAKINSLQSALFKANQTFLNDKGINNPTDAQKADPKYIEENADWLQAEADYKNQTAVIAAAQASLGSASLALSQTSSTITAPAAGIVKGLTISPGSIITVTSSSNSNTSTSQVLGSIYQAGPVQAQVNLSEIDAVKVSEGQKVTMTIDAFPNQTFTGKVTSIDTNGVVASSVTTYPAVVSFDTAPDHIYPNMGVSAKIITGVKENVLLVPSAAVQTRGNTATVRALKNNSETSVTIDVGDSNDTQTEITSGLTEGQTVVTGGGTTRTTSSQSTSVFGGGNFRFGGFGGGGR